MLSLYGHLADRQSNERAYYKYNITDIKWASFLYILLQRSAEVGMGSEIITFNTGKTFLYLCTSFAFLNFLNHQERSLSGDVLQIVCGRWKVINKLGAGGCGSVYKVEDLLRKGYIAALKAEAISEEDSGVLKLEAGVLKKLANRKHVIRLLQSGRRAKYREKQQKDLLHEIGFVHRDVKPGNMMNGASGRDQRIIFLIDYGMVRNFVVRDEKGSISLRKPRKTVLLRGTLRYCSISVHKRLEQVSTNEQLLL
uniref:Protein kinase domain-containing protein n=1 Tax=Heterorhabditis bacteriophora TaxID=37862 RepID=A0A1I7WK89_HETBA